MAYIVHIVARYWKSAVRLAEQRLTKEPVAQCAAQNILLDKLGRFNIALKQYSKQERRNCDSSPGYAAKAYWFYSFRKNF